jgi:hypothetical protein
MQQLIRTPHLSAACVSGQQIAPANMQHSGSSPCRFYTEQMKHQLQDPQKPQQNNVGEGDAHHRADQAAAAAAAAACKDKASPLLVHWMAC